jgi:hypothetical protein
VRAHLSSWRSKYWQAGPSKAGTSSAGTSRAGTSRAGTSKAGTSVLSDLRWKARLEQVPLQLEEGISFQEMSGISCELSVATLDNHTCPQGPSVTHSSPLSLSLSSPCSQGEWLYFQPYNTVMEAYDPMSSRDLPPFGPPSRLSEAPRSWRSGLLVSSSNSRSPARMQPADIAGGHFPWVLYVPYRWQLCPTEPWGTPATNTNRSRQDLR